MANPFTPTQLRNALKKWFPVGGDHEGYEFWPDWETRGRPGGVQPAGFTIHHTGGPYTDSDSYMEFLFETGRPAEGIPGPLCQFAIGASGKLYIGSIGRANHAGSGDFETRQAVGSEDYDGYNRELKPDDNNWLSGNGQYYGVEICYPGTLPMKPVQYKTAVRLAAMVVDHYGWTALSVFAHREHSNRKIDPGKITLYQFRKDVRALLLAGPEGENDMASPTDIVVFNGNADGSDMTMAQLAARLNHLAGGPQVVTRAAIARTEAKADAIIKAIDELPDIDSAAFAADIASRLAHIAVEITVSDETDQEQV